MSTSSIEAVVLAAGLGTRMKSELPKVTHTVCGLPMLELLLRALNNGLASRPGSSINIVVGYKREAVAIVAQQLVDEGVLKVPVRFTVQAEQLGTGHAVKLALGEGEKSSGALVAVFNGDLPLFTQQAFEEFLAAHSAAKSSASLLSFVANDPSGYGRVIRKGKLFTGVVEQKDATPAQAKVKEVNGGVYLFNRSLLTDALNKIGNKNKAGEYYLPGVFAYTLKQKKKILAHAVSDQDVLLGVNNLAELAVAEAKLYSRTAHKLLVEGVRIYDPAHTYIGPLVTIERGSSVGQGTVIAGRSRIASDVAIGAHCVLKNVTIGANAVIKPGVVAEEAQVGDRVAVGPMAHFRPGTVVAADAKVGNFVEVKSSTIGPKSAVSHLSYVGDAQIGARVNIGCGFVTCNYDGKSKHKSIIGDDVFIGSDSQVVAPITIAAGSYIGSGSTVTDSVPEPDSLVIARTRQVTKPGYAKRYRKV